MNIPSLHTPLPMRPWKPQVHIDWRLLLFFLLLMLLPFILFAGPRGCEAARSPRPMPTDPTFAVTFSADTLKESFPAVFSSLTIALTSIPDDTVYVIAWPGTQLNVAGGYGIPDTLLFTPFAAALNPQEIKVKPWNDTEFEGWHTGTLLFTVFSDDPAFDGGVIDAVDYVIEDNDLPPGITSLIPLDTILQEGLPGVDLAFALTSIPTDTVYITIDPDDQLRITGIPDEPVTLVFAPDASSLSLDYAAVRAVDDALFEGLHAGAVTFTVTSADPVYAAFTLPTAIWEINDNDSPPAIISNIPSDTTLAEGLPGVDLLFALASEPTDSVYITIDPDDQLRITGIPGEAVTVVYAPNASALNFNGAGVRAVDDYIYEGTHTGTVTFSVTSADPDYDGWVLPAVTFPIIDNDSAPGITFSAPAVLTLTEGETEELPVVIALHSVPTDTVYIHVQPDDQLRISEPGVPVTLVFPPNTSALNDHVANIKVYDDYAYEGAHTGTVSFEIETSDAVYAAFLLDPITVAITDNDVLPSIIFSDTSGFAGTEGDSLLQFTVRFGSAPAATITMSLVPDLNLDLGKGPGDEVKLKFKSDSALIDKLVDVFITDDFIVEGAHFGYITITLTGDDTAYTNLAVPDIRVAITDNDIVSIAHYDPAVFNMYPVPAAEVIRYTAPAGSALNIYNVVGERVYAEQQLAGSGQLAIDSWPPGTYHAVISHQSASWYCRFVKL